MMDSIVVKRSTYQDVKPWILTKHYARRMPCVQYAFQLLSEGRVVGVVTYGQPASPWLCKGVAGDEYRKRVIELNRLVVASDAPQKRRKHFGWTVLETVAQGFVRGELRRRRRVEPCRIRVPGDELFVHGPNEEADGYLL